MPDVQIPGNRTEKLIHYIVAHTKAYHLGAIKLSKVMWHADVLHYRRHGRTISGQESYERKSWGPVPNNFTEAIDTLKNGGLIEEKSAPIYSFARREFHSREPARPSWFSKGELETIHESILAVVPLTASNASQKTHGPIWKELSNGEQIPIPAAAIVPSRVLPKHIEWAAKDSVAQVD